MSYREWFDFNSAQRTHMNLFEACIPIVLFILVAGITYPQTSAYAGFFFMLSRGLQAYGQKKFTGKEQVEGMSIFRIIGVQAGNIA